MERDYFLQRKRSHAASARDAATGEIRLIHLDLAGRYSVKAAASPDRRARNPVHSGAATPAGEMVEAPGDAPDYEHLEIGARWLASRTENEAERQVHLGLANKYARLRLDAVSPDRH
jgi:hypothetical protein